MSPTGFTGHAHPEHAPAVAPAEVPLRHDWTLPEVKALYELPLLELVYRAQTVHRAVWKENKVQLCSLLSIKTGGCPEDCGYCPQSARHQTGVKAEKLMGVPEVLEAAKAARDAGATRFCMGAAWREVKDGPQFDSVLQMVRGVKTLGLEACCTLGMVTESQALRLKEAGLDAYNHNLDTSEQHYGEIISTRTYGDRKQTLERVRQAGIGVCCGGIIGLGESVDDRCWMMVTLANEPRHPESVPVNALVPVAGTPLEHSPRVDPIDMVRTIAVARLLMPASMVRLSAGRAEMSQEAQLLCMMAGANSVFFGDKLLTTGNPEYEQDLALFQKAGIAPLQPNVDQPPGAPRDRPSEALSVAGLVDAWARETLSALERGHLRRFLEPLESPQGPRVRVGGRSYLNFSSNDYLGLANDAEVIAAGREALLRHGLGAGASRLVVGDSDAHQSLEQALADFEGAEAALLFNSGYAANVGVISALFGPGDVVFSDALNHASLIDGCRLSRAQVVVYPHRDVETLEALVRSHPGRRRAVVTDTVFSMDGDRAPLRSISEVCERHALALIVDEAHATGVLGERGRGLAEQERVEVDVQVGTLSKALGGFGAYACGSKATREVLLNQARSLVFSTALPPAWCAAAQVALSKLAAPHLRASLAARIGQLSEGLEGLGFPARADSAVFSVVLGSPEVALATSTRLREAGLLVKAIRPPTVPEGTSRLRLAVSAAHSAEDVEVLLRALASAVAHAAPQPAAPWLGGRQLT